MDAGKIIGTKEGAVQTVTPKFRQDKGAKQGSGTAGEPFVDANNWAVVLLNLFLPQRQSTDERNIETPFNTHYGPSVTDLV